MSNAEGCYALDLNDETYPISEDFDDETTRVKWDNEEVIQIDVWDDYNDQEKFEIFSLGEGDKLQLLKDLSEMQLLEDLSENEKDSL